VDKRNPTSIVDGQFSMPFCAAVVLREGTLSWDHYGTHLQDEQTLDLGRRISTIVDPRAEAAFPENMAAVARIRTKVETYEAFIGIPKGEPDNFLSKAEFLQKFNDLCGPYLSDSFSERLATGLLDLDDANSVSSVIGFGRTTQ